MQIEHVAIWVSNLEEVKAFYTLYFNAKPGPLYINPQKKFKSYFLSFSSGCRLEIMQKDSVNEPATPKEHLGMAHFAISLGSKAAVNTLTEQLRTNGFNILSEPRTTGDGYYESVILDPENNPIELTI